MGWHYDREETLREELIQKDDEIRELKAEIEALKNEVNHFHPVYSSELEDYKRMHKEEE